VYSGSAVLEAGTYMVRFAIADSEGRMGSVERKFDAWQMSAAGVTVGDLLVAEQPTDGKSQVVASLEPQVGSGRLAAMMEIYAPNLQSMSSLKASLDVIPEENGKPLASVPMQIGAGPSPEIGVLQASLNTTALPPGRYLARAAVTEGGKARGHISRPFRVVAGAATTDNGDLTISRAPSLPADLLTSMLANLPAFDRKDLLQPDVLAAVFTAAERSRPSAKAAIATARAGKMGPAALEALEAGDQPIAAFIRGLDFFAQGLTDRALQQFQLAMQQVPSFAPARLYLGASLAQGNRHREAAGLLQSVSADVAGPVSVARLAGLSWLRAGDASLAIAAMKPALGAQTDAATTRTLALAYVAANRPPEALPLLTTYLQDNPTDQEALLAGVYATYATHSPATRADTITADRMKAQTWAKAYAAQKGVHQALVDAWIRYLASAK
jgi:tetratricopeptide (TPR) repeat protein